MTAFRHRAIWWAAAKAATRLRVQAGQAGTAAPELAEATAALQILACELAPAKERAERNAELWRLHHDLPAGIMAARNGPYLATNVRRLRNYLGEELEVPPQVALCRCGESAVKPFCDGSHARNGFTDAKDPERVPDRLDTYPGVHLDRDAAAALTGLAGQPRLAGTLQGAQAERQQRRIGGRAPERRLAGDDPDQILGPGDGQVLDQVMVGRLRLQEQRYI
jgi:CDGSH-type Zn-finger protein